MATELSSSLEDYIETIYHLVAANESARVTDIAKRLDVRNASVTGALNSLASKGLVNYSPYDEVTLTASGRAAAEDVVYRHRTLRDFLLRVLSIEEREADDAACRMEHAVPAHVLKRLADFAAFVENCPRAGADWIERFRRIEAKGIDEKECSACIEDCCRSFQRKRETEGRE